jgi:hypothetical protein
MLEEDNVSYIFFLIRPIIDIVSLNKRRYGGVFIYARLV